MDGRAQTTIDFGIAMGIFLIAVTTVVAFLPEMIEPFSGTPTQNPLVADRVANQLVDYQLAGSGPSALNTTCTLYFFSDQAQPSNECPSFESDATTTVNERLGIDDLVYVNVTVEQYDAASGEYEILCGDLGDGNVTDPDPSSGCESGEHRLSIGNDPADSSGSVSIARRAVYLDGREDAMLYVRVWG